MSGCSLAALIVATLLSGPPAAAADTAHPFRYPEAKYGHGELKYVNGLPVLTVEGTPDEIGEAVGALAVRPAPQMAAYPEDLVAHFHLQLLWGAFVHAGRKMVQHFPLDYRDELEAIARASGADRDRLVLGNTLFDLKKILACSALLVEPARSATGQPLLGRNLDYPSLGYAHEYSLVTVYRPAGAKHAFASIGFPGLVGCLSGINDAGLSLAVLEVFQVKAGRKRFDSSGMPYALCYRRILEECATIGEARELLEQMPRVTITNLALADCEGVAVFEVTPRCVRVRRPQRGTCVCTNHFCTEGLAPFVPLDVFNTFDRYEILEKAALARGKLSLVDLHRSLDAARQQEETMQTMIFEPAALRVHLAVGTCPSSAGPMKPLELAPLFGTRNAGHN
ncbi:MAG TPA: C45 family peptidase [Gemmataceae bacterium]|jgi:hypothetical protein|nr:C45 family peptidase [Gemmataceae bacterium]